MKTKICNKCNTKKSINDFYLINKNNGLRKNTCKKCISENNKIKNKSEKAIVKRQKNYEHNKELVREINKKYYIENKNKRTKYLKDYSTKNKDKINKRRNIFYKENKKELNLKRKEYVNNRIKNDLLFKIKYNIKSLIRNSIIRNGFKKKNRTNEILGCLITEFKTYIENKWEPWMTWDNYGKYNGEKDYGWDLDHIFPSSTAVNEADVIKLNHYTNFQPLCSYVNRVFKRDNL